MSSTSQELLTSAANPLIKRVRLLADRRHRRRDNAFVVQGVQPVWRAVRAGAEIETLLVAPELLADSVAPLVSDVAAGGVRVARLSAELFRRIADRDSPTGLAAIVRAHPVAVRDLPVGADSVFVALHEIGNPGNLGTIIRTADATGAAGVLLSGACADPYDPTAVKASMGSLFAVPVVQIGSAAALLAWTRRNAVALVVTSPRAEVSCFEARYSTPLALLLGSEGAGLPAELLSAGQLAVRIPMTGTAESLNLAVAAGIMLYRVQQQAGAVQRGEAVGREER